MAWVRIDDSFSEHPKWADATSAEIHWFIFALCYCNRNVTDGFIPGGAARRLIGDAEITIEALLARGIIKAAERKRIAGFEIVGFLDYQPSKEAVLHERELAARRMARWRKRNARSYAVTDGVSDEPRNAVSYARVTHSPIPIPVQKKMYTQRARARGEHVACRDGVSAAIPIESRAKNFWSVWREAARASSKIQLPAMPRSSELERILAVLHLFDDDEALIAAVLKFHALTAEGANRLNVKMKTLGYFKSALARLLEPEADSITRREFEAAKRHRARVGGCQHDPKHENDWRACVRAIALAMRGACA